MISRLRRLLRPAAVAIPAPLWDAQLARFAPLSRLDDGRRERLRALCAQFLARKSITGAAGLELDAAMQLHIAVQACLPILELGLDWYRDWRGIVVYPARFRVRRRVQAPDGLEFELDAELAGEAWEGGPVILSWDDSAAPGSGATGGVHPGNVVIHEFAHTLDLLDGSADGIPPLDPRLHPGLERAAWEAVLDDAYARFCEEVDLLEAEIPAHVDPDSPAADPWYGRLPLDAYAATDPAEFFAVSSEALFMDARALEAAFAAWTALLRRFYRLDR